MACDQADSNRSPPKQRPRGIREPQPLRKCHKQSLSKSNHIQEVRIPLSPTASNISKGGKAPSTSSRKRKRGQEQEAGSCTAEVEPKKKKEERKKESTSDIIVKTADPLEYWTLAKRWPKEYFEQHGQTYSQIKEDLDRDSWLEEQMAQSADKIQYVEINGFRYPCPIKKVPRSLNRKQSDSSLNETCDQTNREKKSAPYRTTQYTVLLERKGSYMYESDLGITKGSEDLYQSLLELEQSVPKDSLFRDNLFKKTCRKIEGRNEARVMQDIARLIVPSTETLATYGAAHLDKLIEGVNEGWKGSIPVEGPRPQPDYSVGFRRSAFNIEQLKKLDPFIGSVFETSIFVATYRMYFPFFTCEVKCGASAIDIADRQNAHSMTIAVRAIIELFKSVKREKELNQKILAFSISHDHRFVKIYGHYPIFEGDNVTFYRHQIHEFSFVALGGKEKWTAYRFTKNVYDHYMPKLYEMICSAIDDLPADINFDVSQSASFSQSTPQRSQQSSVDSVLSEIDSQSSFLISREVTPTTTPFTQATEPASKRPRDK
ncbi:MAG: hypothetical protein LQ342_001027 [Letrouitia transgressa]|nr:MAG: hypothetical protein LQ342_001027 [Letrouitia transgressa]